MVINEIFPKPTVKQIIFQIKFPKLFYIENKIGDFQAKIMETFTESDVSFRKRLLLVDKGKKFDEKDFDDISNHEYARRIWEFKTPNNVRLNVLSDSIDISSEHHVTYNLGEGEKFRDTIRFVIDNFLEIVRIPIINRIGLRYIDECPVPSIESAEFKQWYNTCFPLGKFKLNESDEMIFTAIVKRESCFLRYIESFKKNGENMKYNLDFDGYAFKIKSENYLEITDKLHDIISNAYEKAIKEPLKEYMKNQRRL